MKGSILDRAVCMATGKRLTARKDRIIKLKVKQMAADRIIADRQGRPSATLMGKHLKSYGYGGGIVNVDEHENGILLTIRGRSLPEWFFRPRADEAHQKARLIRDYVVAIGKWEVPSEQELETVAGSAFEAAARRIKPDGKKPPATLGVLIKKYPYSGGVILYDYAHGVVIDDNGKMEWYREERKRNAFDKAKYLSGIAKAKKLFA